MRTTAVCYALTAVAANSSAIQGFTISLRRDAAHLRRRDRPNKERVRILRETKAEIEELETGKPVQQTIEAAPGSIQSGPEIEIGDGNESAS